MQGSETVDDAIRARMTERGLDFLAANFKEVLRAQFPPDPSNPNQSRIALGSQAFQFGGGSFSGDVCLQGNTTPAPPGCISPQTANKVSSVLVDISQLENQITMDFIQSPQPGIRMTIQGLRVGLDARIHGNVSVFGLSSDADCDLVGATSASNASPGTLGTIDITAVTRTDEDAHGIVAI
jgi:hypothetical protein